MSGLTLLNWALIAVSFFNTITLLWLGLTVLLNADRRAWRTWIAGGGLVMGGFFFAGHSAVVGHDLQSLGPNINFWWWASWIPVISGPYLWYLVSASYTGVLGGRWHRLALAIVSLLGFAALALLVIVRPLPSYSDVVQRVPISLSRFGGVPVIALVYPIYSVVCIVLSLRALHRPETSARFMGDLARRRAQPWLVAASLVLLSITFVFAIAMAWFLSLVQARPPALFFLRYLSLILGVDLVILGLVAVAVVLTGRAIVSYEIFTGKALPRGGLRRYWRRSLGLAAGYGIVIGGSLNVPIDPVYRLLLATILMTFFYALLGWRSYTDREQGMDYLRPFVKSQQLYERLLNQAAPSEVDIAVPFRALCEEVLGARVAYLTALGPLAPLAGFILLYPDDATFPPSARTILTGTLPSPQLMCVPLDPTQYGGAVWGVPLWSERGLIGMLLLGEKRDGGLYTQEEIEIARATGERLIDTQASAEMARRLMALQRQKLQESQLLDRRARRVLHDDVLPRLHTAMLMLSSAPADADASSSTPEVVGLLGDVHRQVANLLHALPSPDVLQVGQIGLIGALRQVMSSELRHAFDEVRWHIESDAERRAEELPTLTAEVIAYAAREAVRNAARYGRHGDSSRLLHLDIGVRCRDGLEVVIEDDGIGLDATEPSGAGSGQGLALHSTMMAVVGGTLTAESVPGIFTRVSLLLPNGPYAFVQAGS